MNQLEREFRQILNNYGHHAILAHYDRTVKGRCEVCGDKITGSFDDQCLNCFGTGRAMIVEKILVREEDSNITSSLSDISKFQAFGEVARPGRFYFMNKEVNVKEHDLILDVDWEGEMPVYTFRRLSEVSHVDVKRFERGNPVFQKVYTQSDPFNNYDRAKSIVTRYINDHFN